MVEAQHVVSTAKLTDTLDEQTLLEAAIERAKPPIPPECRHLDFLLATPFRYRNPYGSRFRRPGALKGVFYGAESADTAAAEVTFHRIMRFYAESPDTPWPANAAEYTAFAAEFASARSIDLTAPPLNARAQQWTHPTDYGACQALGEAARAAGIDVIRYTSVRAPSGAAANLAILTCRAFTRPEVVARQTWRIHLGSAGGRAICEAPRHSLAFGRDAFAADPRIAAMRWER